MFEMPAEFCPACGHHGQPSDLYCRGCGTALSDDARAMGPIAEAQALVERGLLDESIATIQRAIGETETPELHVALATLHLRRGGMTEARRSLDTALTLDPRCAVAHAYAGGLLLHAGQVHEAQEELEIALSLAPDDLIVLMKRAELWIRLGIFDRAKDDLRRGLRNGGGTPQTRALAEAMYAAAEKRSRGTFVRQMVKLPSLTGVVKLFKRPADLPAAPTEVEA
jgi:Flp pilus assembly protein TadD